ncbi:hypothetical protein SLL00_14585 [Metabacillus indicus]|uniref:hypothetical protein n=1 Tax=Metabacillus indicus TaxID=246786 RepID=UPI002A041CF4|nr:hypothetical protein [Metabacillus indicus]MDX8291037.1 hypothetical protein [Metabacillus indicus]
MRKLFIAVLFLGVLSGCTNQFITFSGESKSWTGKYTATIDGNEEQGSYEFHFKDGNESTQFKVLEINVNNGRTTKSEENLKGATITLSSNCRGCSVTEKGEEQKVTIKWDDENEETFYMQEK